MTTLKQQPFTTEDIQQVIEHVRTNIDPGIAAYLDFAVRVAKQPIPNSPYQHLTTNKKAIHLHGIYRNGQPMLFDCERIHEDDRCDYMDCYGIQAND